MTQRTRDLLEVADGVVVARAEIWSSLSTVVLGPDGTCLVADPGITPNELDALAAALEARGLRVTAGFSTHPHWDHVLWSARLGRAPRWATPAAVRRARHLHDHHRTEADALAPGHDHELTGRLRALPSTTVPWEGPRAVVVGHAAHCVGHAGLALPDSRTLLAGDMLSDREVPLLDTDAADPVGDYRDGLDRLEDAVRRDSLNTLVPGHGTPARGARAIAARFIADRRYLDALEDAAHTRAAGATVESEDALDPRLVDPWVAGEHRAQLDALT